MSVPTDFLARLFDDNRAYVEELRGTNFDEHDPSIVTVSCCDARVSQDRLFGSEAGENFTVGKIGNVVSERDEAGEPIVAGSVVYPLEKTSPAVAIVTGHTDCGAVTAAYAQAAEGAPREDRTLQNELDLLVPIVDEGLERFETDNLSRDEQITRLVEYNVDRQVETLRPHAGNVPVVGVVCDLHGYYGSDPGRCHLVNYRGSRRREGVPVELSAQFARKLAY